MKINAELFLDKIQNIDFENRFFFLCGNESSFISGIENLLIKKISSIKSNEKIIIDYKDRGKNLEQLTKSKSLFSNHNIIQIKNPNDSLIKELKEIDTKNNSIIINGERVGKSSKIKKYFEIHKKHYSVACYKLSKNLKKKLIDNHLNQIKQKLKSDAYWYFVENSSDEYQILLNDLEKISNYKTGPLTIKEIKIVCSDSLNIEFDELFIQCFSGTKELILKKTEKKIQSLADAFYFLQIVKKFLKILILTSEKKNKENLEDLTSNYLPKYLFKEKNNFKKIVTKATLKKIIIINQNIQKTELFVKRNEADFLILIQRFLLNCLMALK